MDNKLLVNAGFTHDEAPVTNTVLRTKITDMLCNCMFGPVV
jgi:hypothetical protein